MVQRKTLQFIMMMLKKAGEKYIMAISFSHLDNI
jgi:hypothetical protein